MKKIKEFFERYKAVSVTALALFAVCSVVVIAGLVKTYAQANGTVYLSKVIDRAYPEDDFSDQVHLFKAEYDGTVRSEDGKTNVIAPGTRNSYTLDISNDTQQDLYYGFKVYAEVKNSPLRDNVPLTLPVALSVTGPDGELIRVGLDGEEGHKYLDGYSIKAGRVQSFAFYWEWLFETGDDEADTMWGNAATSEAPPELDVYIQLCLGKDTYAYTATFDPVDGTLIGRNHKLLFNGAPYGEMPGAKKENFSFLGWFTDDGKLITSEMIVTGLTEDITLHARYERNFDDYFEVRFDPNGGTLDDPTQAERTVKDGEPFGDLPKASFPGKELIGWNTEPDGGGEMITTETLADLDRDITLYAIYEDAGSVIHVTFDAGVHGNVIGKGEKTVVKGGTYGDLPYAKSPGKNFIGWNTKKDGSGTMIGRDTIVNLTGDVTLYAFYIVELNPSYRTSEPNQGVIRYGYPQKGAKVSTGDWELVDADRMNWVFHGKNGFASGGWFFVKNQYSAGGITTAQWFHFNEQGLMDKGWIKVGEKDWYHLREIPDGDLGSLEKGWYHDDQDQKTYYLDPETGLMWYGWQEIDGEWYYFADEPDIAGTNWVLDSENYGGVVRWVYDTDRRSYGSMFAGEMTPDGHYVREDGTWDGEGEVPTATKMTPPTNSNVVNGYPETLNGFKYELKPVVGTNYEEIRKRLSEGDQKDTDVYRRIK